MKTVKKSYYNILYLNWKRYSKKLKNKIDQCMTERLLTMLNTFQLY